MATRYIQSEVHLANDIDGIGIFHHVQRDLHPSRFRYPHGLCICKNDITLKVRIAIDRISQYAIPRSCFLARFRYNFEIACHIVDQDGEDGIFVHILSTVAELIVIQIADIPSVDVSDQVIFRFNYGTDGSDCYRAQHHGIGHLGRGSTIHDIIGGTQIEGARIGRFSVQTFYRFVQISSCHRSNILAAHRGQRHFGGKIGCFGGFNDKFYRGSFGQCRCCGCFDGFQRSPVLKIFL